MGIVKSLPFLVSWLGELPSSSLLQGSSSASFLSTLVAGGHAHLRRLSDLAGGAGAGGGAGGGGDGGQRCFFLLLLSVVAIYLLGVLTAVLLLFFHRWIFT